MIDTWLDFFQLFEMETVDVEAILSKIFDKCVDNYGKFDCLIWTGATFNGRYGRIRNPFARYANQPSFVRTHRLVYLLQHIEQHRDLTLPHVDAEGHNIDISHVCHNKLCVRGQHLTMETHMANCSRRDCVQASRCVNPQHNPPCLV